MEGEGVILLDGALQKLRPFQLYLLVPGMIVEFPEQGGACQYYGLWFESIRLAKTKDGYAGVSAPPLSGGLSPGLLLVHQPQQVLQSVAQLYQLGHQESLRHSVKGRLLFDRLMHELLQQEQVPLAEARDERIERSILYIEQHYPDKISIEQLARAAGGMSSAAFSRLFRQETGMPPLEYLNNVRMTHAKRLLNNKESRVKEVAAEVGFRSEFYFSRMFQHKVGVAPTLYMKRGRLKVAVASSLSLEDHLRSLGIEPVCVVDLFCYPGQSQEVYRERLEEQLRQMSTSRPDLIIADDYHTEFRERLKQTAPPVFLDFSVWDWQRNFEQIAELVNREREASEMLTRLYVQSETTGQSLRRILGVERVLLMQVNHRAVGIQGTAHHPLNELVYGELGLQPGGQSPAELWRLELQPEAMPVLETEHLFIHQHHVLAGSGDRYREMVSTSAWTRIEAVRRGHLYTIPNWYAMSWTPLGRQRIMRELLSHLDENASR
ncbi:hypothetical protein PA598K_04491 [Paenibacillus sp. 598K]|nr:hypothetical protein PA598K_04491 [Paenibacillus sp. 598K]